MRINELLSYATQINLINIILSKRIQKNKHIIQFYLCNIPKQAKLIYSIQSGQWLVGWERLVGIRSGVCVCVCVCVRVRVVLEG